MTAPATCSYMRMLLSRPPQHHSSGRAHILLIVLPALLSFVKQYGPLIRSREEHLAPKDPLTIAARQQLVQAATSTVRNAYQPDRLEVL